MSGWIKFDKDMASDPRLMRAAGVLLSDYILAKRSAAGGEDLSNGDALRLMCNALRGALVTLWCYADEHIRDDDTLPCDAESLDAIVGIDGFCNALPDEWLTVGDDSSVTLPSYCQKNSLMAKRKKANRGAERQKRYRERMKASHTALVTHTVTHNGKHNGSITLGGDQDQDQDQDNRKRNAKRSRRAPDDFTPDLTFAESQIPDVDASAEAAKFKDWEFKTPRSDWNAVWRTWIRNCKDSGKYSRKGSTQWM